MPHLSVFDGKRGPVEGCPECFPSQEKQTDCPSGSSKLHRFIDGVCLKCDQPADRQPSEKQEPEIECICKENLWAKDCPIHWPEYRQPSEAWEEEFENKFATVYHDHAEWKKAAKDPTVVLNFIRQKIAEARREEMITARTEVVAELEVRDVKLKKLGFGEGRTAALVECLEVVEGMESQYAFSKVDDLHVFKAALTDLKQQIISLLGKV